MAEQNPAGISAVALEIWKTLRSTYDLQLTLERDLALYAVCLDAARGVAHDASAFTR